MGVARDFRGMAAEMDRLADRGDMTGELRDYLLVWSDFIKRHIEQNQQLSETSDAAV